MLNCRIHDAILRNLYGKDVCTGTSVALSLGLTGGCCWCSNHSVITSSHDARPDCDMMTRFYETNYPSSHISRRQIRFLGGCDTTRWSQARHQIPLSTSSAQPAALSTSSAQPAALSTSSAQPAALSTSSAQPAPLSTSSEQPAALSTSSEQPAALSTSSAQPAALSTSSDTTYC